MKGSSKARDIDAIVGRQIRRARAQNGITARVLAARAGMTAQQLSKFERNLNRVHAEQLWVLAQLLGRPIDWFFEGDEVLPGSATKTRRLLEALESLGPEQLGMVATTARMLAERQRPPSSA